MDVDESLTVSICRSAMLKSSGCLGPNGAGKSTSFRMICGMIEPDRGRVYLGGRDVTNWPMFRRARDGHMGYLPQEPSVFKKLTVEQNISALLELLGMDRAGRKARTQELLEEFNITHIRKSRAGGLSGGERRRLEIARCLVSDPKIVMLDEPFAGIDPVTVQSIQGVILQLRDNGISVLITDHAAREILGTVDRCYVIYQGQVLIDGTPEEVKQHPKVAKSTSATWTASKAGVGCSTPPFSHRARVESWFAPGHGCLNAALGHAFGCGLDPLPLDFSFNGLPLPRELRDRRVPISRHAIACGSFA